ncbi:F-box domain protein [Mycena sanguinolenta]|uniref:F-box domain protein n=1 Tax=Mycena sanguinolenta TaxID=230812 RepID=A0A8H6ZGU2_9AGAR|nr:F-box domain protein [Mycena sanguinolenta]
MSIAQTTVISSPELLEHTLTHLPMRDLLVTAPLVSQMWHAITLTTTLQRLLFFEPDTSSGRAENPLLVELFPPFFAQGGRGRWTWPNFEAIKTMAWSKAPDAFKRPEASWRRMLVTQPPARRLVMTERSHAQDGDFVRRGVLDDPCLRMGVLYDLVLPLVEPHVLSSTSFLIRWPDREDAGRDEIALGVVSMSHCTPDRSRIDAGKPFYSDAAGNVNIEFGEWVEVPRGRLDDIDF